MRHRNFVVCEIVKYQNMSKNPIQVIENQGFWSGKTTLRLKKLHKYWKKLKFWFSFFTLFGAKKHIIYCYFQSYTICRIPRIYKDQKQCLLIYGSSINHNKFISKQAMALNLDNRSNLSNLSHVCARVWFWLFCHKMNGNQN